MKWVFRALMKLAHRFHWHYAPPQPQIEPNEGIRLWCQWCGLRGTVWTAEQLSRLPGAIKADVETSVEQTTNAKAE